MITDKDRIKMFLDYIKKSKNAAGLSIGDKNGMRFQHVESGRNDISEKLANDIIKVYPKLNYTWLLTGEGNMLNDNHSESENKIDLVEEKNKSIEEINSQKRVDQELTIVARLTKMLEDAHSEISNLRQELDRRKNS